jgi:hypothetical protein
MIRVFLLVPVYASHKDHDHMTESLSLERTSSEIHNVKAKLEA